VSDSLDDLAAFLMHRMSDTEVSEPDRLRTFAVVGAYQEGDDPAVVEPALRALGAQFADHADYRPEWSPTVAP
jgi:hypothetical protein